ncbi:extracellular solute-binding protein [Limibaculum sp. FT325]|nr:extracellular solute-binding protein [Limibaculum sediminis]MCL5778783.1 extracellular solute-binding protein [Limibaculum sediminis]
MFGEVGGFDSLNPFILKGRAPWAVAPHMVESLMARSQDEPFTLYGLLAETVETPPDRSWVEFTLRPQARFSDGSPVTVEDVIWSFETLGREGHPRYRNAWDSIAAIRRGGERTLRIEFSEPNRELPLILGLRPVLKRAQWEGRPFGESGLEPIIGSGPYFIADFEPGRFVTFRRDPDWWGADLPVNRGLNNFDEVRYEYFRNADALWQAVQTGAVDFFADADPVRWAEGYEFPAALSGRLVRTEIAHGRPTGMDGFVFNSRRAPLSDRRVREALALAFDWEWVNERLYRGELRRIRSFFDNSPLGFDGPAEGREREILAPFAAHLPPGTLEEGWRPPVSDGTGRDRRNLRAAAALLDEAGWTVVDGQRRNAEGRPLVVEALVVSTEDETLASIWSQAVARLGAKMLVRRVDAAQYQLRRQDYDFDIVTNRWSMSLSPGTEQRLYFGAAGRETPGTRNYMGVADPAVEAAIDAMLAAEGEDDFRAAVRALDRVLMAGIYVVPFGALPTDRIAHSAGVRGPERAPLYGWWGWWAGPGLWWRE